MTGILLLAVAFVWIAVAALLARATARALADGIKRSALGVAIFVLLLPVPVADEILGGLQLWSLCTEGAVPRYSKERLRGRSVRLRLVPHPQVPKVMQTPTRLISAPIPIEERTVEWADVETDEVLLSYKAYRAKGGLLIRVLGISSSNSPLTIHPSSCAVNEIPIFAALNVKSH